MDPILALEAATGLPNADLCRLLGVSRSHMNHFRNRGRPVPAYIAAHCKTLLALSPAALKRVVRSSVGTS